MNCYPFIEAEKAGRRNVARACALLKVSRTAFYQYLAGPSRHEQQDAELSGQIQAVHGESKGRYGAPRCDPLARGGVKFGQQNRTAQSDVRDPVRRDAQRY